MLIADICPDMISRSCKVLKLLILECHMLKRSLFFFKKIVMFEFPWQFGLGAFALYLIGIAQTLADVSLTGFWPL